MADEPFSSAREIAAQGERERRQLVLDYKGLFNSPRGQKVLADLQRKFGFGRPSAVAGMRNEDVWLREGMKMPLHEIERMRSMIFRKNAKPKRALSEHHHEPSPEPPA